MDSVSQHGMTISLKISAFRAPMSSFRNILLRTRLRKDKVGVPQKGTRPSVYTTNIYRYVTTDTSCVRPLSFLYFLILEPIMVVSLKSFENGISIILKDYKEINLNNC